MTPTPDPAQALPLVAIVGRPNVGKSTLFNRLCGGHEALVEDEPGVTRDRRYGEADWAGRAFRVVDTGGLDPITASSVDGRLSRGILAQAMRAVEEAELVLFVGDAREGPVAADFAAAEVVRKSGKPVLWVANKVDRNADEGGAHELYRLGADVVYPVSATHGRGMVELCDAILDKLPGAPPLVEVEEPDETRPIRLALVGRPNAGKSSLVNLLVGEERMLVDAEAGTTRDAIDTEVELEGRRFVLIDTAGIRRRARVEAPSEKIAVAMAEKAVRRADVCVLVIDAEAGIAEQDAKIAGLCESHGRALVIAFNKLDRIDQGRQDQLRKDLQRQLQFVPWAKVLFVSARTGKGHKRLVDAAQAAYAAYIRRVGTGELNRWFEGIVAKHPPSLYKGLPVKLYFIQQPQARPPTFVLSVNHPEGVHFSYRRYLANQLRESFQLDGTPVRIVCRARARR
jgi:GTP-binding protein